MLESAASQPSSAGSPENEQVPAEPAAATREVRHALHHGSRRLAARGSRFTSAARTDAPPGPARTSPASTSGAEAIEPPRVATAGRRGRRPRAADVGPAIALGIAPGTSISELVAALARVSTQSELAAIAAASAAERTEARLAAETARALHALLCGDLPDASPSWDVSARLSRMRAWLAGRAASDPTVRSAAGLCEQVVAALAGR